MDWLAYFCLGVVVGCVCLAGGKRLLAHGHTRPVSLVLALALVVGSSTTILVSQQRAVLAYPPGLLLALLWTTADIAWRNTVRVSRASSKGRWILALLGVAQLLATLALTAGAAILFIPQAIQDVRGAKSAPALVETDIKRNGQRPHAPTPPSAASR